MSNDPDRTAAWSGDWVQADSRWLVGAAALISVVYHGIQFVLTDGWLVFTLDDAHIHLALADRIAQGTYGINPGEFAAPSSSILWPLVLAAVPVPWLRPWTALVLNAVCMLLAVRGIGQLGSEALGETIPRWVRRLGLLGLLVLGNVIGVSWTGMEHAPHGLATVLVLQGLRRLDGDQDPGLAFWIACVVGPWLRYEGWAVTAPALAVAAWAGRWRGALGALGVAAGGVGAFSWVLSSQGNAALPTSVMSKLGAVFSGLGGRYRSPAAWGSALWLIGGGAVAAWTLGTGRSRAMAPAVLAGAAIHLLVGRYGWFGRYEVYIVVFVGVGALWAGRDLLRSAWSRQRWVTAAGWLGALLLLAAVSRGTVLAPFGVRMIHLQHAQMHRFTQVFPGNVAVNDLGWVAWKAPHRVLDLWGLGSEKARRMRAEGPDDADYLSRVIEGEAVGVAMIYPEWFEGVPSDWEPLGVLSASPPHAGAKHAAVSFYLVDPGRRAAAEAAIAAWVPGLPSGATFTRANAPASPDAPAEPGAPPAGG